MKKALILLAIPVLFYACGQCGSNNNTEEVANEIVIEGVEIEKEQTTNVLDSLDIIEGMGEVVFEKFSGLLPAADTPGQQYTLELAHQEKMENGVYTITQTFIDAEGPGIPATFFTYGKYHTELTGSMTRLTLESFDRGDTIYFKVDSDNSVTLVDIYGEASKTNLNYTLDRVTQE